MTPPELTTVTPAPALNDGERDWLRALTFYRSAGEVIFLGEGPQTAHPSLTRLLVESGVKTRVFDSTKRWQRFRAGRATSKGSPVIWVQGGIPEKLAKRLPYISVFSVLDDIYSHDPQGVLAERAQMITTQNSHALARYARTHRNKTRLLFPSDEIRTEDIKQATPASSPPPKFPRQVMGHIGPLFHNRFDFHLLESFVETLPEWGFLLAGSCDKGCKKYLERLNKHPNFWYAGDLPRYHAMPLWRLLSVALLLYKDIPTAEGAFPISALEATHFAVPCVLTKTKICADLEDLFPHRPGGTLKDLALERSRMDRKVVREKHTLLAHRMSPKLHLTRVANVLAGPTLSAKEAKATPS